MKAIITSAGASPAKYNSSEGEESFSANAWITYDVDAVYDAFVAAGIDPETVTINNAVCTDGIWDVEDLNLAEAKEAGIKECYVFETIGFAYVEGE